MNREKEFPISFEALKGLTIQQIIDFEKDLGGTQEEETEED